MAASAREHDPLLTLCFEMEAVWPAGARSMKMAGGRLLHTPRQLFAYIAASKTMCNLQSVLDDGIIKYNANNQRTSLPICQIKRFIFHGGNGDAIENKMGVMMFHALLEDELYGKGQRPSNISGMFERVENVAIDRSILSLDINVVSPTHTASDMRPGEIVMFNCSIAVDLNTQHCFLLPNTGRCPLHAVGSPSRMRFDLLAELIVQDRSAWWHIHATQSYLDIVNRTICDNPIPSRITQRDVLQFYHDRAKDMPLELSALFPGTTEHLRQNQIIDLTHMSAFESVAFHTRWWSALLPRSRHGTVWYSTLLNSLFQGNYPPAPLHVTGGILASGTGLGKTRTCISLAHQFPGNTATLVLTKSLCVATWAAELETAKTHLPDLRYAVYHGNRRGNMDVFRELVAENHIVVCVYDTLLSDRRLDPSLVYHRLILDEAHTIKATHVQKIKHLTSVRRWAVTPCPFGVSPFFTVAMTILQCLMVLPGERHPVFWIQNLKPVLLEQFGTRRLPLRLFTLIAYLTVNTPLADNQTPTCTPRTIYVDLQSQNEAEFTRYTNSKHNLVSANVSCRVFERQFNSLCHQLSGGVNRQSETPIPLLQIPDGEDPPDTPDDVCAICLNDFDCPTLIPCNNNHFLCCKCALDLVSQERSRHKCPFCRSAFNPRDLRLLYAPDPEPSATANHFAPKLLQLHRFLNRTPYVSEKVLIITRFSSAAHDISTFLRSRDPSRLCFRLTSSNHANSISRFRKAENNGIMVGTLSYLSTGVNLLSETQYPCRTIIFFEPPVATDDESLVLGRLVNLATDETVRVVRMLYMNTVEQSLDDFHRGVNPTHYAGESGLSTVNRTSVMRRLLSQRHTEGP